jgi:hypothetical protein
MRVQVAGQERIITMETIRNNVDLPADRFAPPEDVQQLISR